MSVLETKDPTRLCDLPGSEVKCRATKYLTISEPGSETVQTYRVVEDEHIFELAIMNDIPLDLLGQGMEFELSNELSRLYGKPLGLFRHGSPLGSNKIVYTVFGADELVEGSDRQVVTEVRLEITIPGYWVSASH